MPAARASARAPARSFWPAAAVLAERTTSMVPRSPAPAGPGIRPIEPIRALRPSPTRKTSLTPALGTSLPWSLTIASMSLPTG